MRTIDHVFLHFFPHRHNNHKARALHPLILFSYLLFFVFIQFASPFLLKTKGQVLGFATNIAEAQLLSDTNQKRVENGLKPLKVNAKLSDAARNKATYMFAHNFWAHNAPDGTTPWKFISDVSYDYVYAGENLARDFENSQDVVDAWMNSPTHRANLLQEKYQDVGFAVVNGNLNGEDTTLVVQMFGTPVNSSAAVPAPLVGGASQEKEIPVTSVSNNFNLAKFLFTKEFSLAFIGFLMVLLLIDGFFIWRRKIVRISGHNFAHLMLLGSLLITVTFLKSGSIL